MEDLRRIRNAADEFDGLAKEAAYQRLLKGFRREEEEGHRRRLLFGDAHLERGEEKMTRPG
ncbi:MAG: hypothetical protein FDZ69_11915 [Deltaproteobacteria bacterium]|nr:MAG: hypothetical protein FDZ69_11915 [Deltaproteobacteria bacterium]